MEYVINLFSFIGLIKIDIDEKKLKIGHTFDYKMSGISENYHMELPTEAGFPVQLQMGVYYSVKVDGVVSAEVKPSLYSQNRGNNAPRTAQLDIKVNPM